MNKAIKRRLIKQVLPLAAIIIALAACHVTRSFIRAETTAVKTGKNEEYFSGQADMGAVEITRASSNAIYAAADFILTALIGALLIIFVCYGGFAVYKYIQERGDKE
jgi:hypothetical protein